ncbi:MAG: endo-polygalacturonase [Prevotella sp.]|nr:endo-polygalacturonase [Prevotella sp.]
MFQRLSGLLITFVMTSLISQSATVKTYPAAIGAPMSHDFSVQVRIPDGTWQNVPVYLWKVDHVDNGKHNVESSSVASFDFEGEAEVRVVSHRQTSNDVSCGNALTNKVSIRPLSTKIIPVVADSIITFSINRSRYLSVEIDNDQFHNLHLFANPMQEQVERGKDVIYFGPGYHDLQGDSIVVKSGQTLFIDGGAYVKGWVSVWHANDARVVGHGIVNPDRQHEGIMVRYSNNITVDGPLTTQIPVGGSSNVNVLNAKCISWYGWGDGMNVFASSGVNYKNVFCRTSDDCSTIYCTRKGYAGSCRNIRVDGAVYWADVAHPIMIGLHGDISKNEVIEDVIYHDIDILNQSEQQIDYQGCIGINNGDNILVRRIIFDDIRIESLRCGMLFNLRVCYNRKYCHAPGRGIRNITFRNVSYMGTEPNLSIVSGYDTTRIIDGLHFESLTINGLHISDDMPSKPNWYKTADYARIFVGEHVKDISFK